MQYKCPQCSGTMLSLRTVGKSGKESKNLGWIYCSKCNFVIYLKPGPENTIYVGDPKGLAKLARYYKEQQEAEKHALESSEIATRNALAEIEKRKSPSKKK